MGEMMGDSVIRQAEAAAADPANGAPDVREARRAEIARDPDFLNAGPRKAALLSEMRALTGVGKNEPTRADLTRSLMDRDLPAADRTEKSKELRADLNEEHRTKLTKALLDPNLSASDRAEKLRELRETLGRLETDDERDARLAADPRERYSMKDPKAYASNKEWVAAYDQDFRTYETDLADVAHAEGFDAPMVRGLRDAAIELGQQVVDRGDKPATAEELTRAFDKLRVPAKSRPALVKLWRSIEGQA
jgi:hypothetical protein